MLSNTMENSFCQVADVLSGIQYRALRALNRKFAAAQRVVALLEQLGDVWAFIPDITKLIPIWQIDLSVYANLINSCPYLGLPSVPSDAGVNQLRQMVSSAYSRLISDLVNHPYLRMNQIQDQMNKYQSKFNAVIGQGNEFIQCLQAACAATQAASQFIGNISSENLQKEIDAWRKNFVTEAGRVTTNAMEAKKQNVTAVIDGLRDLSKAPAPIFSNSGRI